MKVKIFHAGTQEVLESDVNELLERPNVLLVSVQFQVTHRDADLPRFFAMVVYNELVEVGV